MNLTKKELAALLEGFRWCSGSADFGPGGQAEEGWNKLIRPLMELLKKKLAECDDEV